MSLIICIGSIDQKLSTFISWDLCCVGLLVPVQIGSQLPDWKMERRKSADSFIFLQQPEAEPRWFPIFGEKGARACAGPKFPSNDWLKYICHYSHRHRRVLSINFQNTTGQDMSLMAKATRKVEQPVTCIENSLPRRRCQVDPSYGISLTDGK